MQEAPKQAHSVAKEGSSGKPKRRARNFMLQPLLQVRIGLYSIILSVLFAVALGAILYFNFASLINSIVLMTDAEDEVREIFMSYWKGTQLWVYLTFLIYLVATIAMSVLYTHKLVGPTIAFRRHIRSIADGKFNARTYLRKGDAFLEVADELNRLSEVMEKKSRGQA
jgi:hypothetical protein